MEDLLLKIKKPGRYIGGEFNSILKKDKDIAVKFGLCFPGLYELGMSNLGLRIIYGLLNSCEDYLCERFFLPGADMLSLIKRGQAKFGSLESGRALSGFDIVGFSLQHELDYTNVLAMLDIANIPLYRRERGQRHPLIIAGGPGLGNPEPIALFFDLFLIGEAEELLLEVISEFKIWRNRLSPEALLEKLAAIDGVYAPQFYEPIYDRDLSFKGLKIKSDVAPPLIKRRFISNLDDSFYPENWLVPYIAIVHDKILVELMRGCPHSCYFCQARMFYHPFRIKSKEKAVQNGLKAQEMSGYEELSLLGLSASDHPDIKKILKCLIKSLRSQCVSISLGSLRPTSHIAGLLEKIAEIKRGGLTLAIESASPWLRHLINKKIDLGALKELITRCFYQGYKRVKLYFMFGLPFEKKEDLTSIADLIYELAHIEGRVRNNLQFVVSINPFIPKPHTVFQWHSMDDLETLERKKRFLKSEIFARLENVKIDFRSSKASLLEGFLSRADRRAHSVIFEAFRSGAIMDSYVEHFDFFIWERALAKVRINSDLRYNRAIPTDKRLVWEHIDMGCDKKKIRDQYEKVLQEGLSRKDR